MEEMRCQGGAYGAPGQLLLDHRCWPTHGSWVLEGIQVERMCHAGTGKSTYMRRHLAELPASEWAAINVTLSARTSAGALQNQVTLPTSNLPSGRKELLVKEGIAFKRYC